jgi:hypothetical protein
MNGSHVLALVIGMLLHAGCAWLAVRFLDRSREQALNEFLRRKGGAR